ncbi:hypothetical protein [Sulfolobus acidocaldarius]|uniref:Conserved protein n=4 Tax=Sulfolobus acidocaldarius TaxID=2285 RepID=Q4J8Y5_SULAC|nr:hypothetical protein [Sulfolobus acidocaldarius]AAY80745.1 conserved protein [Sulfolobus acidocaldarius DSM 639]AGE71342.1 hypothetical protein SacN8_06890 [Sulfolobus acidocaldarius N8]AGE73611.1 hypothetical protein SacRon12I_06880 [Sulfolobus acidocaldarius Ron12/I]ALU30406.1 hypothetical protein ATY89_10940 [Sulfolobus acidocaldarius]ALU31127.1 hypothetical protein ATZ20_02495 [Sulfolobus acidocaldarius]
MRLFKLEKKQNQLEIINNTPKKVLLRRVALSYEVTTFGYEMERVPKLITEEVSLEKEVEPEKSIRIPLKLDTLKRVSIVYRAEDSDITLREDIDL